MIKLGVNIDHVATLRQARRTPYPDPVKAALVAELAGADAITLHLREDRRHIQDSDVEILRGVLKTRMNLESAVTDEMTDFALRIKPHDVCLVPERREELTTEGGLDVLHYFDSVQRACRKLAAAGIRVSLFIDADAAQIIDREVPGLGLHQPVALARGHRGPVMEGRGARNGRPARCTRHRAARPTPQGPARPPAAP